MRISYLGPGKTYSEKAAQMFAAKIRGNAEIVPKASLDAVARSLVKCDADLAVMAYHNALAGVVKESAALIEGNSLRIVGVQRIHIEHSLGAYQGSADYSKVYSHRMALAQCSDYLCENYPESWQIHVPSTAAGAVKVKEAMSGLAIAHIGALCENGLEIIAMDIGNKVHGKRNFTDFYLLSKKK